MKIFKSIANLIAGGCLIFFLTGCVIPGVQGVPFVQPYRLLDSEPFSMPSEFPVVPGATQLSRNVTVTFRTSMSFQELKAFYVKTLTAYGLTEATDQSTLDENGLYLVFWGWPGGEGLTVKAANFGSLRGVSARIG